MRTGGWNLAAVGRRVARVLVLPFAVAVLLAGPSVAQAEVATGAIPLYYASGYYTRDFSTSEITVSASAYNCFAVQSCSLGLYGQGYFAGAGSSFSMSGSGNIYYGGTYIDFDFNFYVTGQLTKSIGNAAAGYLSGSGQTWDGTTVNIEGPVVAIVGPDYSGYGTFDLYGALEFVGASVHQPVNTSSPSISGTTKQGQSLSADPGTWSGDDPKTYVYDWQRCTGSGTCTSVATAAPVNTYNLTADDVGYWIKVRVTVANDGGTGSAESGWYGPVTALPPTNQSPPVVSGNPSIGQTLTTTNGTWSGAGISYTYAWQRCNGATGDPPCSPIVGATGSTYVIQAADAGKSVRSVVSASNTGGSGGSAQSNAVYVSQAAGPANSTRPTISGTPDIGQTLTASPGTWTGFPAPIAYTYQWQACSPLVGGHPCRDLDRETGQTYKVSHATVQPGWDTIRVKVQAVGSGLSDPAISDETAMVTGPTAANQTLPQVVGVPVQGQTLTTTNGTWQGYYNDVDYAWLRCTGSTCNAIPGANGTSYTLTANDVGATIQSEVTVSSPYAPSATARSNSPYGAIVGPPRNTVKPAISGTPHQGQPLTATSGTWTGNVAAAGYTYQWQRCFEYSDDWCVVTNDWSDIRGATGTSYTPTAADVDWVLRVVVTAYGFGTGTGRSDKTAQVLAEPPSNDTRPVVTGVPTVGQTLSTTDGTWTNGGPLAYARSWWHCNPSDSGTSSCTPIPGASGSTYTLVSGDVGFAIRSKVTASDSYHGTSAEAFSQNATTAVTDPTAGDGAANSSSCTSSATTVADGYAGNAYVRTAVEQRDPKTTWVCLRVSNGGAVKFGARIDVIAPGATSDPPRTDTNAAACTGASGDLADHPPVTGTVLGEPVVFDTYVSLGEAWICLQVGSQSTRVIVPVPSATAPQLVTHLDPANLLDPAPVVGDPARPSTSCQLQPPSKQRQLLNLRTLRIYEAEPAPGKVVLCIRSDQAGRGARLTIDASGSPGVTPVVEPPVDDPANQSKCDRDLFAVENPVPFRIARAADVPGSPSTVCVSTTVLGTTVAKAIRIGLSGSAVPPSYALDQDSP